MQNCAVYPFVFDRLKISYAGNAVTGLTRTAEPASDAGRTPFTDRVYRQVMEYWRGERRALDFPCLLRGTPFQEKVWRALRDIPYGETRTYGQLAAAVGSPRAFRAVGQASGQNPILIAVPCHRVVGANGKLTGYAAGTDMKAALLALEQAGRSNPS